MRAVILILVLALFTLEACPYLSTYTHPVAHLDFLYTLSDGYRLTDNL